MNQKIKGSEFLARWSLHSHLRQRALTSLTVGHADEPK